MDGTTSVIDSTNATTSTTTTLLPPNETAAEEEVVVSCPYLDTIQRTALDFDFDEACSVTVQRGPHIYVCCVCGKYYRGKSPQTPAYIHAVTASHYIYFHFYTCKFYCLPDNYEIVDPSLRDIQNAYHPTFATTDIATLDANTDLSRDLFGRLYLPGFVGLNNLHKTDGINSVVQALAHIRPLRNFFLTYDQQQQQQDTNNTNSTLASASTTTTTSAAYNVTYCFASLVRQLWSNQRFKSQIDPHKLVHAITVASNNKYRIGHQIEIGEFMAWFLHQLHLGTGGGSIAVDTTTTTASNSRRKRKKITSSTSTVQQPTSIIHQIFQGVVRVTTRQPKRKMSRPVSDENDLDDRAGSDIDEDDEGAKTPASDKADSSEVAASNERVVEETVVDNHFLQLTLDLSEKPLFRDQDGGLVIPQEPLVTVLQKFDGTTVTDTVGRQKIRTNGSKSSSTSSMQMVPQRKTYQLLQLPDVLILHIARFPKHHSGSNKQRGAKNPTIVIFPVKNLDLTNYVQQTPSSSSTNGTTTTTSSYKYDLVANIVHDSPADVGREGTGHDPLQEGSYKCHVQHHGGGTTKQWYEIQDLHVQEIMPQQIGVSESYMLILERTTTSS